MKEGPNVESTSFQSPHHGIRKLSFGSSIVSHVHTGFNDNSHAPTGFHVNLLSNSLSNKLRQFKAASLRGGDGDTSKTNSKPPRQPSKTRSSHVSKSILTRHDRLDLNRLDDRVGSTESAVKAGSSSSSAIHQKPPSRCLSVTSVASDKPTGRSFRSKGSKVDSRRSNSAGPLRSPSSQTITERAHSELALNKRDTHGSAVGFRFPGESRMVKVIKRDGVFKPVDKYAPARQDFRDVGYLGRKGMCDYDLYVLPLSGDENAVPVEMTSPRGYLDSGKKPMKVSWDVLNLEDQDAGLLMEGTESRLDGLTTASTPNNNQRVVYTDNFAFRRPIYSSGRSRVASIGVKWMMPTVSPEEVEREKPKPEPTKKPMWSWLVMHENKQQSPPHKTRGGHATSIQAPQVGAPSTSSAVLDVRIRHCRDVHPVSTAMNREGTSVSKTKWHVPSSSASTLDAERAVRSRLEYVKRPRPHLLHDQARGTSNSAAQKFRETMFMQTEEDERSENGPINIGLKKSDESEMDNDILTTHSSTRRDDQVSSSPTKSRSTYY